MDEAQHIPEIGINLKIIATGKLALTHNRFELKSLLPDTLVFGSYPEILTTERDADRTQLFGEIWRSYLYRDILELSGIRNALIENTKRLPLRDDIGKPWENSLIVERDASRIRIHLYGKNENHPPPGSRRIRNRRGSSYTRLSPGRSDPSALRHHSFEGAAERRLDGVVGRHEPVVPDEELPSLQSMVPSPRLQELAYRSVTLMG